MRLCGLCEITRPCGSPGQDWEGEPSHQGAATAPMQMGIQELALCDLTSWWESSALKGNVYGVASLPPDPKGRTKPLKQRSALGIRNGFKFRVVYNQVVIAYSKRSFGKYSCICRLSITLTNVCNHQLRTERLRLQYSTIICGRVAR